MDNTTETKTEDEMRDKSEAKRRSGCLFPIILLIILIMTNPSIDKHRACFADRVASFLASGGTERLMKTYTGTGYERIRPLVGPAHMMVCYDNAYAIHERTGESLVDAVSDSQRLVSMAAQNLKYSNYIVFSVGRAREHRDPTTIGCLGQVFYTTLW